MKQEQRDRRSQWQPVITATSSVSSAQSRTPGRTVEDVCIAEARFIETVIARHPQAEGNRQSWWQLPERAGNSCSTAQHSRLTYGPIVLVGFAAFHWARWVRGKNPLRYLGGVLGGTYSTALAGDMGKGYLMAPTWYPT